jgi:acetyl-CoA/propionyl-CoA carboxylase biotin carboxyl carrier protein
VRFLDFPLARGNAAKSAAKPAPKRGARAGAPAAAGDDVLAPMHGVIVELPLAEGAPVNAGDVVAVIEAMKMMNEIRAHKSGVIAGVMVAAGDTVEARTPLLTIRTPET